MTKANLNPDDNLQWIDACFRECLQTFATLTMHRSGVIFMKLMSLGFR